MDEMISPLRAYTVYFYGTTFSISMNWKNYGFKGWHIDHIIPCCKFDLSKENEQRKCFHYTNLNPMWAIDNLKKGSCFVVDS